MQLLEFTRSRRGGELLGLVVLAAGTMLLLSLVTYHTDDSSAFHTSTNTVIANAIGYYRATMAWLFVSFFGFASLLFPAALLAIGWQRLRAHEIEYAQTKLIGFALLTIVLPPLFDLAIGKVWLRNALIPSGGYLGAEINRARSANLNRTGAAIVLVTALLVGILLATRISLAAVFGGFQQKLLGGGRALSLQWARFTERRRKEKRKGAIVRKHLEKIDAPPQLRLVEGGGADDVPVVREVKGAGRFQIRKVTKADLRKAAEELSKQERPDPFELYVGGPRSCRSRSGPTRSSCTSRRV